MKRKAISNIMDSHDKAVTTDDQLWEEVAPASTRPPPLSQGRVVDGRKPSGEKCLYWDEWSLFQPWWMLWKAGGQRTLEKMAHAPSEKPPHLKTGGLAPGKITIGPASLGLLISSMITIKGQHSGKV